MGRFFFWLLWPIIVAHQTQKALLQSTGEQMTSEEVKKLRTELRRIKKNRRGNG